jgi:carbonic anhydrase/acetyltransferase-like protein (isoleucine patch superfamily)
MIRRSSVVRCAHSNSIPLPAWAKPGPVPVITRIYSSFAQIAVPLAMKMMKLGDKLCSENPKEDMYRIPRLLRVDGHRPKVLDNCFIAPSALVTGNVTVGRKVYIGYNAIIRADGENAIHLGESCNVQEKAIVTGSTTIGKWSTIEPMAIVESADVASCSFVGAGAIVMKNAKIESQAMLCAGAVLQAGSVVPSGEVWAGNPAEKIATLTDVEKQQIVVAAKHLVLLNVEHHDAWELTWEEIENIRITREHFAHYAMRNQETRTRPYYVKEPPRRKPKTRTSPMEMANPGKSPSAPAHHDSVLQ